MQLSKSERNLLEEFADKITPITEFETRFSHKKISRSKFLDVLNYYKTETSYEQLKLENSLDVFLWENNYNQNNTRITIQGVPSIQKYCKDDKINSTDPNVTFMIKDSEFWSNSDLNRLINEKKIWTEFLTINGRKTNKKRNRIVYDSDYGFRMSLKSEIPVIYNSSKKQYMLKKGLEISPFKASFTARTLETFNRLDKKLSLKTFRYKLRRSFMTPDKLFRIDFTIVKSSANGRTEKPVKSFVSSRLLQQPEHYEIEIEYVGDSKVDKSVFMKSFTEYIGTMVSKMQDSKIPITITKQNIILNQYRNLVLDVYIDNLINQIKKLEKSLNPSLLDTKLVRKIDNLKKNLSYYGKPEKVPYKRCWIGPKPITLEKDNFMNINTGYSVTDKADGERTMLFIDNEQYFYFIMSNMTVVPVVLNNEHLKIGGRIFDGYNNIIIDGEFIRTDKKNESLNRFLAFDIYIKNKTNLSVETLKERYKVMTKLFSKFKEIYDAENKDKTVESMENKLWYKQFYFSDDEHDIFELSKQCYENAEKNNYNIDGLIFTPSDLPVGLNEVFSDKLLLSNDYRYNHISGTWKKAFKWKPLDEQSIDFYVETVKNSSGKDKVTVKSVTIDGTEHVIKYKTLNLFVGINQLDKSIKLIGNPCSYVSPTVQTKASNFITKMLFTPAYYWYENVHQANIPISEDGDYLLVDDVKPGNVLVDSSLAKYINVKDKSVLEFVYDNKAPVGFRWKILRQRNDKTDLLNDALVQRDRIYQQFKDNYESLKQIVNIDETKGLSYKQKQLLNTFTKNSNMLFKALNINRNGSYEKRIQNIKSILLDGGEITISKKENIPLQFNYGNYYSTAENVWRAINDPITKDNIFGKVEVELDTDKYYQSTGNREESRTYRMQVFHNKYVKTSLIYGAVGLVNESGDKDVKLLDLCCGKGGDLFKWEKAGVKKVLGIDVSKDNIYNRENGACVRYLNMKKKNMGRREVMDVDFLVGDCGESIRKLDAFSDSKSSSYYEKTYLNKDGLPEKFDIVSCQFAIHYFLDTKKRIKQFIENVSDHLNKDGIFVATCLDGETVFNEICRSGSSTIMEKDERNNVIWSIEGKFREGFNCDYGSFNSGDPVGYKVAIKLPSITGDSVSYDESLVNFGYLVSLFEESGFKLLSKETPNKMKGEGMFDKLYDKYISKKENNHMMMTPDEEKLSFMYRYCIFQKL